MNGIRFYGTTGKFTWRMLATVLFSQSIVVFFGALVARGMATVEHGSGRGATYLAVGSALALGCLLAAGLMRRPIGLTLGWLVQVLTLLSGFVVPTMVIVGVIFLSLWLVCLVQGHRVDELQARWAAQEQAAQENESGDSTGSGQTTRSVDSTESARTTRSAEREVAEREAAESN